MTEATSTHTGYEAMTLPHYDERTLADRAETAVADFNHIGYTLHPKPKRTDVVEAFLVAFVAREAEKCGLDFELFSLNDRQVRFVDWRTEEVRVARYDSLSAHEKVRALTLFADSVPKKVWKKKKGN